MVSTVARRGAGRTRAGPWPIPWSYTPRVSHRCGGAVSGRIVVLDRAAGKGAHEMATTVADVMVATLRASGVQRIYGIPGDSLNGFTDAMRRDGSIAWEHVRHEEAAAFAAGAEAALTGELAVCAASCGPGNLHLINGL